MKNIIIAGVTVLSIGLLLYGSYTVVDNLSTNEEIIYREAVSVEDILNEEFNCNAVAPVVYKRLPSLRNLPVETRKEVFIRALLPSILIAEKKIKKERERVLEILDKFKKEKIITKKDLSFLNMVLKKYKTTSTEELLARMNVNPPSVVLAQAAIESGWGTSRFFEEGNNVFGIWTFKGNGIQAASSEARLRKYDTLLEAVEDYLYNLNVGWAYKRYRITRMSTSNPILLINYLDNYSILGKEYVRRLNKVIKTNNLERYDACSLLDTNRKPYWNLN
jgi:Bax protein